MVRDIEAEYDAICARAVNGWEIRGRVARMAKDFTKEEHDRLRRHLAKRIAAKAKLAATLTAGKVSA